MKELKVGERITLEAVEQYGCRDAPSGNIPSDKQKCQPKEQHEFTIKGVKIMAASKKDAIKKFNHRKK